MTCPIIAGIELRLVLNQEELFQPKHPHAGLPLVFPLSRVDSLGADVRLVAFEDSQADVLVPVSYHEFSCSLDLLDEQLQRLIMTWVLSLVTDESVIPDAGVPQAIAVETPIKLQRLLIRARADSSQSSIVMAQLVLLADTESKVQLSSFPFTFLPAAYIAQRLPKIEGETDQAYADRLANEPRRSSVFLIHDLIADPAFHAVYRKIAEQLLPEIRRVVPGCEQLLSEDYLAAFDAHYARLLEMN